MKGKIKQKFSTFLEAFIVAWTACVVMMTQGDLSVFAIKHFVDASETGAITGAAMVVSSLLPWNSQWIKLFLIGLFTAIADNIAHMAMINYEAIATGFGAMLLCLIYEKVLKKLYQLN